MLVVSVSLIPVLLILYFVYRQDKFEKEPLRLLLYAFVLGMLSSLPIMYAELALTDRMAAVPGRIHKVAYTAFVVAALTEEFVKFTILYYFLWKKKEFNESFDAIVYAVFISLGFAAVENFMYVSGHGLATGLYRAITAVPAHALFAVSMGYYFGIAKFDKERRKTAFVLALLVPVLWHGIYDFLLMSKVKILLLLFFIFLVGIYRIGWDRIKKNSDNSRLNPFRKEE